MLYAILTALPLITCMSPSEFVIVSDFFSTLQAIKQFASPHPLVLSFQLWLRRVASKNKDVVFCWIPGHVDVRGNEWAEAAVRSAVRDFPVSYRSILFRDYFTVISTRLPNCWQQRWSDMYHNKLHSIKPRLWLSSYHRCRTQETALPSRHRPYSSFP